LKRKKSVDLMNLGFLILRKLKVFFELYLSSPKERKYDKIFLLPVFAEDSLFNPGATTTRI